MSWRLVPASPSQHLRTLREAGLVTVRVDGPKRFYRIDAEGLARLRAELGSFWAPNLDDLKAAAETEVDSGSGKRAGCSHGTSGKGG